MEIGKPIRTFRVKPNITIEPDTNPNPMKQPATPTITEPTSPERGIPVPNWPVRTKTPQKVEAEP